MKIVGSKYDYYYVVFTKWDHNNKRATIYGKFNNSMINYAVADYYLVDYNEKTENRWVIAFRRNTESKNLRHSITDKDLMTLKITKSIKHILQHGDST